MRAGNETWGNLEHVEIARSMCLRLSEMKFEMECPRGLMMIACVLQWVTFHIDGAVGR